MGKHGTQTEYRSDKIGSQIESIVRAIHKPVLIASFPFQKPLSFLVAFDGNPTARKCVERIASSPLLKGLAVHLVYVGNPNIEMQNQLSWAKSNLNHKVLISPRIRWMVKLIRQLSITLNSIKSI